MLRQARRVERVISEHRKNFSGTGTLSWKICSSLCAGILVLTSLAGCLAKTGTHAPIDVFAEMHYGPGFRSQEPPRIDSPLGAVPISGSDMELTLEQYRSLENPIEVNQEALIEGAELFRVNCSMCHGPLGKGNGPVGFKIAQGGYVTPPNLTEPATNNRTDGEIFGLITKGVYVMPRFKGLLSSEDRWLLVQHIRELQGE